MSRRVTRVEDLMTTAVISLHANDTVGRVREEMALADVRHIPVVDDHEHVIGIVSSHDLVRAHDARHPQRIAEIMTRQVRTVRPSTPASTSASSAHSGCASPGAWAAAQRTTPRTNRRQNQRRPGSTRIKRSTSSWVVALSIASAPLTATIRTKGNWATVSP